MPGTIRGMAGEAPSGHSVIRVFVTYTEQPDPERWAQHADVCLRAGASAFRHGRILRTMYGEPGLAYYAEFEFPDLDSFEEAVATEAFAAAGKDAAAMAIPHAVYLAAIDEPKPVQRPSTMP